MTLKVAMISTFFVRCGIASYTMALSKALAKLGCGVWGVRWPRFGIRTAELVQNIVDKIPVNEVDLIHCQNEYGLFRDLEESFYDALKRLGLPIVTTMHAVGNFQVDATVASASDRVIVHNEFCARHFRHPCVIIPHGCEVKSTPPMEECKKALGIDPRAPLVGYQGFISPVKGVDVLVEAMRGVRNAALLIGGGWFTGGAETHYIMDLKRRSLQLLPGRCQWLGYVPDEKLSTVYGACSIIAYPSHVMTESGALLMALSHSKAVIASDLPPVKEKAKLGALMTFKSRSVKDLTRKIKLLLSNDELRVKLEQGARNYTKSVEWSEIAKRHVRLYKDVIQHTKVFKS